MLVGRACGVRRRRQPPPALALGAASTRPYRSSALPTRRAPSPRRDRQPLRHRARRGRGRGEGNGGGDGGDARLCARIPQGRDHLQGADRCARACLARPGAALWRVLASWGPLACLAAWLALPPLPLRSAREGCAAAMGPHAPHAGLRCRLAHPPRSTMAATPRAPASSNPQTHAPMIVSVCTAPTTMSTDQPTNQSINRT